jgi:hypothetical protein
VTPASAAGSAPAPEFREPAPQSRSPGAGVLREISNVFSAAQRAVSGFFELIVLESKRAGFALAWILGLALAAAILCVTAWMGLMVAVGLGIIALGLAPVVAVLVVVVLNLAAAGGAVFACKNKAKDLMFPATRRQVSTMAESPPNP